MDGWDGNDTLEEAHEVDITIGLVFMALLTFSEGMVRIIAFKERLNSIGNTDAKIRYSFHESSLIIPSVSATTPKRLAMRIFVVQ